MAKYLITALCLFFWIFCVWSLTSCGPGAPAVTKAASGNITALTATVQAQDAVIKAQANQIAAIQASIAALKVPNPVLATFATKQDVANAINAIPVPKEWSEMKAQYAATAAKTTNYESTHNQLLVFSLLHKFQWILSGNLFKTQFNIHFFITVVFELSFSLNKFSFIFKRIE